MRLIDADALELSIRKTGQCEHCENQCLHRVSISKWDMHCKVIAQAPTIDAEPVRHGRWEKLSWSVYQCSACRSEFGGCGADGWSYCPNCGAKMDATDNNVGHKDGGAEG